MKRALLPLVFLAAACGPAGDELTLGTAEQGVDGGTITDAFDEVVFIYDQGDGNSCTGVLIAPHVLLTAAHCLSWAANPVNDCTAPVPPPTGALDGLIIGFGDHIQQIVAQAHVTDAIVAPADPCHNNLALLALDKTVASSFATPRDVRSDLVTAGEGITVVGFGRTDPSGSSGTKNVGSGTVDCVYPDCGMATEDLATFVSSDAIPCPGDGGAPALDGDGDVVGLASWGAGASPDSCGDFAGYVHVPRFADWIANTLPTLPVPTDVLDPGGSGAGGADPTTGSGGEAPSVGGGGSAPGSGGSGGEGEPSEPLGLTDADSDCACSAPGSSGRTSSGLLALALGALLTLRRRRSS